MEHLRPNDAVLHKESGVTGSVVSIQTRSALVATGEGFTMEPPRVMVTVRVTTAAYYGQYCDFSLGELAKVNVNP